MFFCKAALVTLVLASIFVAIDGRVNDSRTTRGLTKGGDVSHYNKSRDDDDDDDDDDDGDSDKCKQSHPSDPPSDEGFVEYLAELGIYGTFLLKVDDKGSMGWDSDLKNIDLLENAVGRPLPSLQYHLHTQWNNDGEFAIGPGDEEGCGPAALGGHYDPYFGCGPATAVPTDQCAAIGKAPATDTYKCSGAYEEKKFDECEVGDLSGKYGAIPISQTDFTGIKSVSGDPLPALNVHYQSGGNRVENGNDPRKFAAVLYHDASDGSRMLCARLRRINSK